jgi:RNA polymerase sigma-70 factor (ECF subfamily)
MERERPQISQPQEVLERARMGDREAFGQLVALHQHDVFTLAVRLVRDRDQASDIAQDAFIRAWRAMPKFRGDAKFSTWMHRITVNTAWTHRTKQNKVRLDPLDALQSDPESGALDPVRAGESVSIGPLITMALLELSESIRTVVVLKDIYDWSHAEIADRLGISVTAAKIRLHRGRKELRAKLAGCRDGAQ